MQRFALAVLALAGTSLFVSTVHAESRIFEPMDVFGLQWVDSPQISPDGQHIVYQRMGFDVMKDRETSALWMIDSDGSHHRPFASAGRGAAWSRDGRRIAYVANTDGSAQIQMHWLDGGQDASITELTCSTRL